MGLFYWLRERGWMFRTLAITFTVLWGVLPHPVEAKGGDSVREADALEAVDFVNIIPKPPTIAELYPELHKQMKHRKVQPIKYWDKVAQCETRQDWQDGGKWGGGLGIYIKTWRNYGGFQFAKHPSRATKLEQITVANRIAVFGYQTKNTFMSLEDREKNRPFFRPPSGFNGWGCIKNNDYLKPKFKPEKKKKP